MTKTRKSLSENVRSKSGALLLHGGAPDPSRAEMVFRG
jgi:hypothetical protein